MSELECSSCKRGFTGNERKPRIFPACGHSFCEDCVLGWVREGGEVVCPEDGASLQGRARSVENFPVNFALLGLVRKARGEVEGARSGRSNRFCKEHSKPMETLCLDHCEFLCADEALFGDHKACRFSRLSDFVITARERARMIRDLLAGLAAKVEDLAGSMSKLGEAEVEVFGRVAQLEAEAEAEAPDFRMLLRDLFGKESLGREFSAVSTQAAKVLADCQAVSAEAEKIRRELEASAAPCSDPPFQRRPSDRSRREVEKSIEICETGPCGSAESPSFSDEEDEEDLADLSQIRPSVLGNFASPDDSISLKNTERRLQFDLHRPSFQSGNFSGSFLRCLEQDSENLTPSHKFHPSRQTYDGFTSPITRGQALNFSDCLNAYQFPSNVMEKNTQWESNQNRQSTQSTRPILTTSRASGLFYRGATPLHSEDAVELDLSNRKISDSKLNGILSDVMKKPKLKCLILDSNLITESGFLLLLKKLSDHPSLEKISLADNQLEDGVFKTLRDSAKKLKKLSNFVFTDNKKFKNLGSIRKEVIALRKINIVVEVSQ